MTRKERTQIQEAMRLFATNDGYAEGLRILRVLTGGPVETPLERAVRTATCVDIKDVRPGPFKFPTD
jgi:hypothetical protein